MDNKEFVHLHVHSEYSLLDGLCKIEKLVKKASELGMKSLAITDHGVMYGAVDFYKAAKKYGIKPIIGCEIYIAGKSMNIKTPDKSNETFHLILLAKNKTGYNNLMKIVSMSSIDGFYYKPRIDLEHLSTLSEGLIATSACLGGQVQKFLLKGMYDMAKEIALKYKYIFKDDYYLELQDHGQIEQKKVNLELIKLSRETGIPVVATNDVHYIENEDYKPHDVLLCIQTSKTIDDENRMRYASDQFYLKSYYEMNELFGHIDGAISNTVKIADSCEFDYEFHVSKLPGFKAPANFENEFKYLEFLCYNGAKSLYSDITYTVRKRLDYELNTIKNMGYVEYFLITWDFIRFSNENFIMTGPGRGSAAGSIVAFTLGITKVDPLKYGLIFERFLNPDRISMPDIDSDFCYERRSEVIDYVVGKYGKNNVSQIITFGTMAARLVIRDVGRAMNYTYSEVDAIAKMIPKVLNVTIDKALELNSDFSDIYKSDKRIKEFIDISRKLEGLPRHSSTHAAGVVISSKPLVEYVPLQKNEDMIVTQFPMGTLEELGLLKMDFLGLRTLTVIQDALQMIQNNHGISIDIDNIDYDDKNIYEMIGEGKTVGIFQLESPGMTNFMKELKPDCIEDIIAGISLYRPGPMSEIPKYISGKKDKNSVKYISDKLKPILSVTYGCMVYQEQVMQIVRDLAGYSMGRSDLVRRAMSKKKLDVMKQERKNFIYGITDEDGNIIVEGCLKKGVSKSEGNAIFDQMMDFASYAFNKSHAAAYAIVGYQTAFLSKYYPGEYMAAMLNSFMGISEKIAYYIKFAKSLDIEVMPPDINDSDVKFISKNGKIHFSLTAIKNVGINVVKSITNARKTKGDFLDIFDFIEKVGPQNLNKRVIESLIKSGAFDSLGISRAKIMSVYDIILDSYSSRRKSNIDGQISLFDNGENKTASIIGYMDVKEFDKDIILSQEKEMAGIYFSGHPLEDYIDIINSKSSITIDEIKNALEHEAINTDIVKILNKPETIDNIVYDGMKVVICGIINTVSLKLTRKNERMAFIEIEDLSGVIEAIIFPKTFSQVRGLIEEDSIIKLIGKISIKEDEGLKILANDIKSIEADDNIYDKIYIRSKSIEKWRNAYISLKNTEYTYSGKTNVIIYIESEKKSYSVNEKINVQSKEVLDFLINQFGESNIKLI